MSGALGYALLSLLWQGAVVGIGAHFLHRRLDDPHARHASDVAALLALPTLFLCTLGLELSRSPSGPLPAGFSTAVALPSSTPLGWSSAVNGLWLLGVAFMSLRLLRAALAVRTLRRRARRAEPRLLELANRLAQRMGLRQTVAVALSPDVAVPGVLGLWRPLIVLPASAALGAPPDYLAAVISHELAHLRRLDPLVLIAQRIIEVFLFFHPATWSISRRLDETREHCCDDIVRADFVDPLLYARALLFFESARSAPARLPLSSSAGPLMKRIQRIVRTPADSSPRRRLAPPLAVTALTVTILAAPACLESLTDAEPPLEATSVSERTAEPDAGPSPASVADRSPAQDSDPTAPLGIEWLPESVESHAPAIIDAAAAHQIDPELLAIIVLVESRGNATVRSSRGARGLMQLMPATAESLAEARGIADHDDSRLDDPSYNLDLGAQFLATQLRRFGSGKTEDEAIRLAAGAYNAGPKRMRTYLDSGAPLPDESVAYMERVMSLWNERDAAQSSAL